MSSSDVRIDKWLWAARFFKTRALAKKAVEAGHVSWNNKRPKPAQPLAEGDRLEVRRGQELFEVEVQLVSDRRGPAKLAQTYYQETEESQQRREREATERKALAQQFRGPQRRPEGRERKRLRELRRRLGEDS